MQLTFDNLNELRNFIEWSGHIHLRDVAALQVQRDTANTGDVAFDTPQQPLTGNHVSIGAGLATETKIYTDGTTATGTAPLPDESPAQQAAASEQTATKRKRRTKAEIEADVKASIEANRAANAAAEANREENGAEAAAAYAGQNAGEAALEAARKVLHDKAGLPSGANPFGQQEHTAGIEALRVLHGERPEGEASGEPEVVTPFQHLTRAREFIGKHGMPKYNESFTAAGLDPNVMGYTAEQRIAHIAALDALEAG